MAARAKVRGAAPAAPAPAPSALERAARDAWVAWGNYAKHEPCSLCGEFVYCRSNGKAGPFLCLACHDQKGTRS